MVGCSSLLELPTLTSVTTIGISAFQGIVFFSKIVLNIDDGM
jgi:hypothetical protein